MDTNQLPEGLSSGAASARLAAEGPNLLHEEQSRSFWQTVHSVAGDPMFALLLGAGTIYLLTGDVMDAMALLGFVCVIIIVTVLQERRTERALATLRDLSSPRALAVRDGTLTRIAGREVVVGDALLLVEGDRVPADGLLLQAHELAIDESLLSGESVPVAKLPAGEAAEGRAYAGTLVVSGQGWLRVTATGSATQFGHIGLALEQVEEAPSPLQREVAGLTRRLAWIAAGLCLLVVLASYAQGNSLFPSILAGITLAMALLPQELPVIMIVFLALGARRMVKAGILTRHLQAIETLGQTTALCVDKTGTLTENRMAVAALVVDGKQLEVSRLPPGGELPETFHELLEYAVLASERTPSDPMERAFHQLAGDFLANTEHLHPDWDLVREYELTPALRAMSHGWRTVERATRPVAAKGAPEAIIDLCHLQEPEAKKIAQQAELLAARGLRVLAVAAAEQVGDAWPENQHDFSFRLLGLIGLADPLRAEVPAALARCRAAGVAVLMITGDHPVTARAIAEQAGLPAQDILSGDQIDQLQPAALADRLASVRVFARVSPTQKLRLVEALKARGEVVAMTGDGVNDAPALKAAHIGIAMGKRGTDVAREAASLVLIDDNFAAIVAAIEHGRRIYDNLLRAMLYTLAVHVPTIALTFTPVLLGQPPMLLPLHIAFLELAIDPACSLVFEAEPGRADAMQRPPRQRDERLLSVRAWGLALALGAVAGVAVLAAYFLLLNTSGGTASIRASNFISIVLVGIGLILAIRNRLRLTGVTAAVIGGTLAALALACFLPLLQEPFGFAAVSPRQLGIAVLLALASFVIMRWLRHGAIAGTRPASARPPRHPRP
jgi:Ca2+-transporting ATPase